MKTHSKFAIGCLLGTLVACSTPLPPAELLQARTSYDAASKSSAAQLAPAQLDTAKQSLDKAEGSFKENGDADSTKDLAYIADVRSQIAVSEAAREQATRAQAKADHDFRNQQLDAIDQSQTQLAREKQARQEAEKGKADAERKLSVAMASLAEIAKVKEESRGVVITLSGAVLFATGKSALLPIAQDKLAEVAKAVKDQGYKSLLVEGHTDAQGSADKNMVLSQDRANSVRSFLISQGIPSDKIRAEGIGSARPVAENSTAEGRANNRRVEIVVEPLK
ncbi:MAG TPA: OmpA family protein [Polyangiaceae bacterium]|jgi:outer membrane protein OmpA-like peptidoglycan-associated protein|nr:OmpA family protein [Polyangiaceae bacterium]